MQKQAGMDICRHWGEADTWAKDRRNAALCRQILSVKEILANILTSCIPEFRGKAPTEVAKKYIEGTPDIGVPILETSLQEIQNTIG